MTPNEGFLMDLAFGENFVLKVQPRILPHVLSQQQAFHVNLDALVESNPDLSPTKPQITSSALARPIETAKSKRECSIYTHTQTPEQNWSPHSSRRINLEDCAVQLPPINQ